MHIPVLSKEVLEILNPKEGEIFFDGTFGGGGHSRKIAERIGKNGHLVACDRDAEAIRRFEEVKEEYFSRTSIIEADYRDMRKTLKISGEERADGALLDLGFSSFQIEDEKRGFSFMKDAPLDMRYSKKDTMTAAEAINSLPEEKLSEIFFLYGEERNARRIANAIVRARKPERIIGTVRLASIIERVAGRRGKLHPATKVFQALRIYVNDELGSLKEFLEYLPETMNPKGRVAIISFHSIEDRIVKQEFRKLEKEGFAEILTKKPITPQREEIQKNPRSRSAKLRAIRII